MTTRTAPTTSDTGHRTRHRCAVAVVGLLLAGLLGACSGADDAAVDAPSGQFERGEAAPVPAEDMDDLAAGPEPTGDTGSPGGAVGFDIGAIGRDVAIEMRVTLRSDDLRATVEGIAVMASTNGGGIASSDIQYGTADHPGWATLVVKVPPAAVDGLLRRLDQLGQVESVGQDAVDVTDQLVDLDVRIRNATQSVDRVRALLADADDLREIIDLESELTRRQTDLERLMATQRSLSERVALATVTIDVLPADSPAELAEPTDPGILDGLRTGWDGFVAILFGLAYGAAVLAPALVLGAAALTVIWLIVRRRRRGEPAAPIATSATGLTSPEHTTPGV